MFTGHYYYNSTLRKAITAFGTLFNGITIRRLDEDGNTKQSLTVPLSYGPKQKFIARSEAVQSLEDGRTPFEITLPRMAFELDSMDYDASRKLPTTTRINHRTDENTFKQGFVSTPYNLGITLSVLSKNQSDGLQIVEQILPYFNPDFNITVHDNPSLGSIRDIQIVLDSVSHLEDYEGDFRKRTIVTWDLHFTMKLNFYGYVADSAMIKKIIQNIFVQPVNARATEGVTITTTTDPEDANPEGDYTFVTEFDEFEGNTL